MGNNFYSGPDSPRDAFIHRHTHPVALVSLLMRRLKAPAVFSWEAETLWEEIQRNWVVPSSINKTKIQAARTCVMSTLPYEYWNTFEMTAQGLFGLPPSPTVMQRVTPWRAGFALKAMDHLRSDFKVESEVWKYVAAGLHDSGFAYAPGILEPANRFLRTLTDKKLHKTVQKFYEDKKFDLTERTAAALQVMKSRQLQDYIDQWEVQLQLQMQKLLGT